MREFHIVVLVGSIRAGSYSAAIANTLDELAPQDVRVTLLESIEAFPHFGLDLRTVEMPKPVSAMARAIRAADGVIITTPEYNHSVPGVLKNALDWLSSATPEPFAAKPVAIVTSSTGALGGVRCQESLRQTLAALDARVLNRPEVAISDVCRKIDRDTGMLRDEEARAQLAIHLAALAADVRERSILIG